MKSIAAFNRSLLGAAVLLGLAAPSYALPAFTINPDAIPGSTEGSTFTADAFSFTNSSELITLSAPAGSAAGTGTGSGWATIGGFSYLGTLVPIGTQRTNLDYQTYITFDIEVELTSGALGQAGSTYDITRLDYKWWVDPDFDTTFTQSNAASGAGGSPATVGGNANDHLLAFGSLLEGVADLNAQGGTGLNATNTFAVCTGAGTADFGGTAVPPGGTPFMNATAAGCADGMGDAFFDQPQPFYPIVFDTFSNTSQGIALSANGLGLAIQAAGRGDFAAVPEPGTVALMSFALLGLGASLRKRSKA